MDNGKLWYILSVILALSLFAPTALILPAMEDTSSLGYQVLFFFFTFGAVVLLFFAANLISDGVKGIYHSLSLLRKALRNRHKS